MAVRTELSAPQEGSTIGAAEITGGMPLVVIHGPPASGKLTVARELSRLTGFKLFHNHLTVDFLLSIFEYGSLPFARLREEIWVSVMREAAAIRLPGLVFTLTPERTVSAGFLPRLAREAGSRGASVSLVQFVCSEHEIESRLARSTRRQFHKLRSVKLYRKLRADGFFSMASIPPSDLTVDTSRCTPRQSAAAILDMLQSPRGQVLPSSHV